MLPPFWRALGGGLPDGAGTETIRRIGYFGGQGIASQLAVVAAWAIIETAVAIIDARFHYHRVPAVDYPRATSAAPQPESGNV